MVKIKLLIFNYPVNEAEKAIGQSLALFQYFALIPFTGNCENLKFETAMEPLRKSMRER
jgi:hypothetical protein